MNRVTYCLAISLSLALLQMGSGCKRERPEMTPDGKVLVEFWHGMGGPLGKVLDEMIADFNASHQDIRVDGISMGQYETLQKKILASVVAQESPDISQNFETLTVKLARPGKLVLLDTMLGPNAEAVKADIIPVLLANNTFDGKLWSFPFNKSVPVLYYNKDMFRAAGLDPDRPPQTLDELHAYAKILTVDQDLDGVIDQWGYGFSQNNAWLFQCRLLQCGGRMVEPDGRSVRYDTEAGVRALDFNLKFLRDKTGYCVAGFEHQNNFIARKVAMIEGSIVSRVFMEKKIEFDFGVAPIPWDKHKAVVISGTNINIFNNGSQKRIDAAWQFVEWFTGTEQGVKWSLGTTYLPVRKSSLAHPVMEAALAKDQSLRAPYVQLDYATFEPRTQAWYDCRDKLSDALEQAYIEVGDPHKYMARATKELTQILQSAED